MKISTGRLSLESPEPQRRRALGTLFLTIFVNLLGFGIIIPLLPFYGVRLGASPSVIGWIFASYSLSQLIASPILGGWSDRWGRRPVLIGSLIGTVLSFALLGVAHSVALLFLSRILDGLSGGNIPTARAYIADITPPEKRAQSFALIGIAFGAGFVFGPAMGGLLAKISLDAPAWGAAALALLATVMAFFWLPETVHVTETRKPPTLSAFTSVLGDGRLAYLLFLDFTIWAAVSVYQTTFALFGEQRFHWDADQVGLVLAGAGFAGALAQGGLVRVMVPRLGEKRVLSLGLAISAVALAGCALAMSPRLFIAILIPAVIGSSMVTPALISLVSQSAERDGQGRVQGVASSLESLGRALGPVWGNSVLQHYGGGPAYLSAAVVLGLAALMATGLPSPRKT